MQLIKKVSFTSLYSFSSLAVLSEYDKTKYFASNKKKNLILLIDALNTFYIKLTSTVH